MNKRIIELPVALLIAMLCVHGAVAASYDEAIDGDLSGNWLAPTVLTLDAGSNHVQGLFGISPVPGTADLDYLAIVVPDGYVVSSLILESLNPGGANSFLGVQSGPQMTMPPTSTDPSVLLGWNHIFKNQQGTDLLPYLGITGGLAAGSYTFWINETDKTYAWSYGFDFQVTAVPEPETWAMLLAGIGLLACGTRRRQRS